MDIRRKPATVMLSMLLASLLAAGCALRPFPGAYDAQDEPVSDLVWPRWPEVPRIRYLHSISSARDIGIQPGLWRRIVRFLRGGAGPLMRSHGLAVDGEGRLFVVDTVYRRVHVFDRVNETHYLFPDRPPEDFINPIGVAVDDGGRVYVSDSISNVIHVFSSHGKQYEGNIGRGRLGRPTGLAFDAQRRRLLVTDTLAASLVIFDEREPGALEHIQLEQDPGFHAPTHIAIGKDGVVVTDSLNFRVQVLDGDLGFVRSLGGAGDGPGRFSRPKGVAVDSEGHLYVVDALLGNVQIFDAEGMLLLAFGRTGTGPGEFWLPNDIFIDRQDRIYVSDAWNQRVQVFQYLHHEDEP